MNDFKVICPFCKKENDFTVNDWLESLIDDSDRQDMECKHCDYPMDVTRHATYTVTVNQEIDHNYKSEQEY